MQPSCRPQGPKLALLLFCVLATAVLAGGCGGGDSSQSNAAATATDAATSTERVDSGPTEAVLQPVGDSTASGTVLYKKTAAGTPLLEIRVKGLEPISGEEKYVVWQTSSPHDMVPLATYLVGKAGRLFINLRASFESLAFLEDGSRTELVITKVTDDDSWREGLGKGGQGPYDPAVRGQIILQGPITGPLVGATETE